MELDHRKPPFALILDKLNGNTLDLKHKAAESCGVTIRYIQKLYSDPDINMSLDFANRFIQFANKNRVPKSPEFTIEDLTTETEIATK